MRCQSIDTRNRLHIYKWLCCTAGGADPDTNAQQDSIRSLWAASREDAHTGVVELTFLATSIPRKTMVMDIP